MRPKYLGSPIIMLEKAHNIMLTNITSLLFNIWDILLTNKADTMNTIAVIANIYPEKDGVIYNDFSKYKEYVGI